MLKLGELALITGTVGFFGLALLLLVPQMFQKQDLEPPQPRIKNLDVSCWTPPEFTANMVAYTDQVCKNKLLNNETFSLAVEDLIPKPDETREFINIFDGLETTDAGLTKEPWRKQAVIMTVVFEFLVIFVFYAIISIGSQGSSTICKIVGVLGHVIAIVFFFLASFIPYIALKEAQLADSQPLKSEFKSGASLCDFSLRRLGNIVRYTVQCGFSYEVPPSLPKDDGEGVNAYLVLNGMIGGAVAIIALGSLVSVMVSKRKKDDYSIENKPL